MNEADALVALGLLLLDVGALAHLEALLEIFEGAVELVPLLEFNGDYLVDAHQLLADLFLQLWLVGVDRFLQGRLQVVHGLENVKHLLFADAESLVGFGLTLGVLGLNGHIEAALVEVGGSLPIVELFKLFRHLEVGLKAFLDLVLLLVVLSYLKVLTEVKQRLLSLLKLSLSCSLVEALLLLQFD